MFVLSIIHSFEDKGEAPVQIGQICQVRCRPSEIRLFQQVFWCGATIQASERGQGMAEMMDAIHQELGRLASSVPGTLGVCVQHVESGERIEFNAGLRFPMASAFKLPIAVHIFSLVERGQISFDEMIEVQHSDLCPGSGTIQALLYQPGLILSLRNLIELALVISDNTANDVLLRCAGGPLAVTKYLRENGITDMRIDRFTKHLVADKYGFTDLGSNESWSLEQFRHLFEQLTPVKATAAAAIFAEDERDTMTPAAMVTLLLKVYRAELLNATSRDHLLSIMQRCQTGEGALKGMLPPGVVLAHKTGTLAEVVSNDVGILYLPGDAGHLAIAVCVKSPEANAEASSVCQRVIAHIGRAVYDYFQFQNGATQLCNEHCRSTGWVD
jgi:beta-lactamase class A